MEIVHGRAISMIAEDRISNLPDDIIHCILSFLEMKYAIQTSILSKKWEHIWTSMPVLNLNGETFSTLPQFARFVKNALSHRNHLKDVSALEVKVFGVVASRLSVKRIVKYAYSHNVRQMSMMWVRFMGEILKFPQGLFSCHTLKHLTLATDRYYFRRMLQRVPKSAWDFPVLETLNLSNLDLGDDGGNKKSLDLFSKCVNLKDLTLDGCSMLGLDDFTVSAPLLSNLTIIHPFYFPKVFKVVAPQLENLTTCVNSYKYYDGFDFLHLSTDGLDCLEKVDLSVMSHSYSKERFDPKLLNLFRKLRSAKFLILDKGIIEVLSSCLDQLLHEPSPFNNLKCLKQKDCKATMPTQLINYFLESSPTATLPQVPQKRSRVDMGTITVVKVAKLAKLEEEKRMWEPKMKMQDEVIAKQKAMIEAMMLQHEKLMSQLIKCNMAELQVQVAGGNPDYELIRSIKSIMELTPERLRVAMEAQFSCRYQEMKSLFLTHIDSSQWAKIETELGITDNVHNQLDISPAAELPSPSSTNMATSSIIANTRLESGTETGSSTVVQPS